MSGFTKLWAEITDSSIWNEDDKTRITWITMLARMGPDFMVRASVGGLAHLARISREDCEKAIEKLSSPDPDSRSTEFEGRRIHKVEGGFYILNGEKHRERRNDEERRLYMKNYMRERRSGKPEKANSKQKVNTSKHCKPQLAKAEAESLLKQGEGKTPEEEKENHPSPVLPSTTQGEKSFIKGDPYKPHPVKDQFSALGVTGKPLACPKEEHSEVLNRIHNGCEQKRKEMDS